MTEQSTEQAPAEESPPRRVDPGPCPISPVGHYLGAYYFFDINGQLVKLNARSLGQSPEIQGLFGRSIQWVKDAFPQYDKDGEPTGWYSVRETCGYLINACHAKGLYDGATPLRDHGVWIADGRVAVHLGDCVLWLGADGRPDEFQPSGFRARGALWPARAAVPPPAPQADAETAQLVERAFQKWRWSQPEEWRVFTGLWAAGLLGAAIRWRPHGLVVGQPGSGKSSLVEFYGALSPLSIALNDFTEAGIRQFLSGRAAPLILDEAEEDGNKLQRVVMLLRRASGGKGAQSVRGTGDGTAQQFSFTSSVMMGSVLPPALMPQDATRITRIDLLPIAEGAATLPMDDLLVWARDHAPALWGRALAGIPRFHANLATIKADLLARGCSPRVSDQLGTIIAARAMMMEDEPLDDYTATIEVDSVNWLALTAAQQAEDAGPMACLMHILSSPSDVNIHGERPSIGTLVYRARKVDGDDARRMLVEHGMMVDAYPRKAPNQFLYVANRHTRLARLFEGTQWANMRWREDLRYLPGAAEPPDGQWFCGRFKSRCIIVPESLLPGADRDTSDPAPPDDEGVGALQAGDPGP